MKKVYSITAIIILTICFLCGCQTRTKQIEKLTLKSYYSEVLSSSECTYILDDFKQIVISFENNPKGESFNPPENNLNKTMDIVQSFHKAIADKTKVEQEELKQKYLLILTDIAEVRTTMAEYNVINSTGDGNSQYDDFCKTIKKQIDNILTKYFE